MKEKDLLECELCGTDYWDKTQDYSETLEDLESIKVNKRCSLCYAEWWDFWPDQL